MSVFDSEIVALQDGWTEEEGELVENVLRASDENGRAYVEIIPAPATLPWGNYDEIEDPREGRRDRTHDRLPTSTRSSATSWRTRSASAGSRRSRPRAGAAGGDGHRQGMSVPGTYTKARVIGDLDVIWEEDTENVLVHSDGRVTRAMLGIVPEDQFPLLKQGYGCAACFVRLDVPFPEALPDLQLPDAGTADPRTSLKNYIGNIKTGPSTTLEDEKLIMQEMREREARETGDLDAPRRLRMKDDAKVRGHVSFVLRGEDGEIKDEWEVDNTVTTAGKAGLADQSLASPSLNKPTHMGLGTGSPGATALGTEIDRNALATKTRSTNVLTFTCTWAAGDGTGSLTEAGLFDAASTGNMWLSASFAAKPKGASDTLTATWTLTVGRPVVVQGRHRQQRPASRSPPTRRGT